MELTQSSKCILTDILQSPEAEPHILMIISDITAANVLILRAERQAHLRGQDQIRGSDGDVGVGLGEIVDLVDPAHARQVNGVAVEGGRTL